MGRISMLDITSFIFPQKTEKDAKNVDLLCENCHGNSHQGHDIPGKQASENDMVCPLVLQQGTGKLLQENERAAINMVTANVSLLIAHLHRLSLS